MFMYFDFFLLVIVHCVRLPFDSFNSFMVNFMNKKKNINKFFSSSFHLIIVLYEAGWWWWLKCATNLFNYKVMDILVCVCVWLNKVVFVVYVCGTIATRQWTRKMAHFSNIIWGGFGFKFMFMLLLKKKRFFSLAVYFIVRCVACKLLHLFFFFTEKKKLDLLFTK